ncbi:hypothetical protein Ancab_039926 [Ancistrocladus abbreviatus]
MAGEGEKATQSGIGSNQSHGEVAEEMSIVIHRATNTPPLPITPPQWLTKLIDEKDEELAKDHLQKKPICKIQRVPIILRESSRSEDNYEPFMLALGPFHHGKPKLQHMEKLKISMMRLFIKGTGKPAEVVYHEFLEVARNAKTDYFVLEPEEDLDNDEFLRILFVDVCFLIQFILENVKSDEYEQTEMKTHEIAFMQRDLFLLENQLPFPILKALMMLRFSKDEISGMIHEFISNVITVRAKRAPWHRRMAVLLPRRQASEVNAKSTIRHDADVDLEPTHLLHALQMQLIDTKKLKYKSEESDIWYSYRSVMELKAAGVHFRPQSISSRLTDMKFRSTLLRGVLSLRPWVIDDQAEARFLNLCAFEALPNAPGDLGVTSYLCFMDSIIDSAEDVKELRSKGILLNFLGSDQQVADMFNDITDRLVPNLEAFAQVKLAIEMHYSNLAKTWLAQFLNEHFSTPWTVIGLLVALLAIALSIIQTFQIHI